jgi:hypothetical protein
MDRDPANSSKIILSWIVLAFCLLLAAWYIKSVFWVSSQPDAISNWHQFKYTSYAFALLVGGIALFGGIRALPDFGRVRIWLVTLSVLLVVGINAWEYLAVRPTEKYGTNAGKLAAWPCGQDLMRMNDWFWPGVTVQTDSI